MRLLPASPSCPCVRTTRRKSSLPFCLRIRKSKVQILSGAPPTTHSANPLEVNSKRAPAFNSIHFGLVSSQTSRTSVSRQCIHRSGTVSPLSASMSSCRRSARKDWRHRVLQRRPHQTTMHSATSDGLTKARTLASSARTGLLSLSFPSGSTILLVSDWSCCRVTREIGANSEYRNQLRS